MKSLKYIPFLLLFCLGGNGTAQNMATSMFADHRAFQVGDVVTILVVEYSQASSEAKTRTEKDSDHRLVITGGDQTQAYSPMMGYGGAFNNQFRGDAGVSRKGQLKTKITATITEVNGNGNFIIQGNKIVEVNGEREMTTITGVVRPQDISGDNTVYSYQVADFQVSYSGKGVVNTGQKPGFITKLFNWIF